jgi:L-threonylcarbamoyladenylate synthase
MAMQNEKCYFWSDPITVKKIVDLLRAGSIILSSTDTVLGLLAPLSQSGRSCLDTLKRRQAKPYIVLLPSKDRLDHFIEPIENFHIENLIHFCWPGPLTLLFKAKQSVPAFITDSVGTIAIRVPDHVGLQAVLTECGGLFSTSANLSDQPVPHTLAEVDPTIIDAVACIIDDDNRMAHHSVASTILDCSHGDIRVVREGAYPLEKLQTIAGIQFS